MFIPEDGEFQILEESRDLEIQMLFYQIDPIRDIMGNLVVSMYMYSPPYSRRTFLCLVYW